MIIGTIARPPSPEKPFAAGKRRRIPLRPQMLAVAMAVVLPLLRVNRAHGQDDDWAGYRKSYYEEDNDRMSVATDTVQFDVGLMNNLRLSGTLLTDATSGATPTGAPPQSQWPYPTYNDLYQSAYQGAYSSQYNQYIAQNQIYYDGGLITYMQLTNGAATYASQSAPNIATNSATSSFQTLTNNPNYHNNSVPLTHLKEFREEADVALSATLGPNQITPSFAYSTENDYVSYAGALNYSLSLNQKNTILSTGFSRAADMVLDDVGVWEPKKTESVILGLVQLCGPKAYFTINGTLTWEHGYLSDPYRGVMFSDELQYDPDDAALNPELRPRHRNAESLYASWTQFVTPVNASIELSYRFFHDSYGIYANSGEIDWNQKITKHFVISPSFRYYMQTAADFYYVIVPVNNNGAPPTFYSADYRLSKFDSYSVGVTFTWRIAKYISFDAGYMRYVMQGLDGVTSPTAYPSANVFNIGLRIWF